MPRAAEAVGSSLCGQSAGAELGDTGSYPPTQLPSTFLAHLPTPGYWLVCAQQLEWECLARTSGHNLFPSLSLTCSVHPWLTHPHPRVNVRYPYLCSRPLGCWLGQLHPKHKPKPSASLLESPGLPTASRPAKALTPLCPQPSLVFTWTGAVVRAWKQHPSP